MSAKLWVAAGAAVVIAGGVIAYEKEAKPLLRVGAGFAAKTICSEVLVAGRSLDDVRTGELGGVNPILDDARMTVEDDIASVTLLGVFTRKAFYDETYGCVLADRASDVPERIKPTVAPTPHEWPLARRDDAGAEEDIDYDALDAALQNAFFNPLTDGAPTGARAVVVVHRGAIIAERYADGFTADRPHLSWSMAKTVIAALSGIAIGRGDLALDETPPVEKWSSADPRVDITLADLLHMASGLDFVEDYADPKSDVLQMLYSRDDMAGFAGSKSLAHDPGSTFYYSSGTTNLIAGVLKTAGGYTDETFAAFPQDALFAPLGMTSAVFETDASGTLIGSSYLYASPHDWARFGQLLLQDGVWGGAQILPEGWVDYMRTPTTAEDRGGWGYGAQTWMNAGAESETGLVFPDLPADFYMASGHDGQVVVVIPSRDMVIVRLGFTPNWGSTGLLPRLISDVLAALPAATEQDAD